MIYIVCDMNCNNRGNYFRVIGHEREVEEDESSYIVDNTYYPKKHCYKGKISWHGRDSFKYSEAIDELIPEDYIRWKKTRYLDLPAINHDDVYTK